MKSRHQPTRNDQDPGRAPRMLAQDGGAGGRRPARLGAPGAGGQRPRGDVARYRRRRSQRIKANFDKTVDFVNLLEAKQYKKTLFCIGCSNSCF